MEEALNTTELLAEIARLKKEVDLLKEKVAISSSSSTVIVPTAFKSVFEQAEKSVGKYFSNSNFNPQDGEIIINDERYILFRAAAISHEFLDVFKDLYSNKTDEEAVRIGNNFLFDIAHVLGKKDAEAFHIKMKLTDPIQQLSAGPVHFAYSGWANVEILEESNPSPNENFFLKFHHHNSFEAQSWIKANRKSELPVCTMNSGYSSGWCEASFGMPLTTVEICCEAQGAERCTFIMAPPHKIQSYLDKIEPSNFSVEYDVPIFFERKYTEDRLKESLQQKETLLHEVHHRVKNNFVDEKLKAEFLSSINRVNTMAKIHEMIYGAKNVSAINIEKYFTKLLRSLGQIYDYKGRNITVNVQIEVFDVLFFPEKAIPLGLILNEIACNSFKYAFDETGTFYLKLKELNGNYILTVGDNGKGLPENIKEGSLGLSLIPILCEQMTPN